MICINSDERAPLITAHQSGNPLPLSRDPKKRRILAVK
nr:MAG TPA: hypothetical protein [Caudoviricetes sp.]